MALAHALFSSKWETEGSLILTPSESRYMVDRCREYLGWRGWMEKEDYQEQFVMDRLDVSSN
jgi:hypothetical protein